MLELSFMCLALNTYMEAGVETHQGKLAVTHVVMNRVREQKSDICTEVFRNKQFSWANSIPRKYGYEHIVRSYTDKLSGNSWEASKKAAAEVLYGGHKDNTWGATHYYASYIDAPYWIHNMAYVAHYGRHKFYRYQRRQHEHKTRQPFPWHNFYRATKPLHIRFHPPYWQHHTCRGAFM